MSVVEALELDRLRTRVSQLEVQKTKHVNDMSDVCRVLISVREELKAYEHSATGGGYNNTALNSAIMLLDSNIC